MTVVLAPTTDPLMVVEVEGAVVDVEGADDPVVLVGAFAAWCRALEQLAATIATATRAIPVATLLFTADAVVAAAFGEPAADAFAEGESLPKSTTPGATSRNGT